MLNRQNSIYYGISLFVLGKIEMDKIEYALITGASAGVGKEMAYMLAKKQKI